MSWVDYFDSLADEDSPILREQAAVYVRSLATCVGLRETDRVLDFGCGPGHVAALLAVRVGQLSLWDPSPSTQLKAANRMADFPGARVCDLSTVPVRGVGIDERHAFDLILVNSVIQYMARDEVSAWLMRWRDMLAPGGRLVLSDLIPPGHARWIDLIDLLRLSRRVGLPVTGAGRALGGVRRYWRTCRAAPLTGFCAEDLARRAADAGLHLLVLPANLTHFRRRWSAVLSARAARDSVS